MVTRLYNNPKKHQAQETVNPVSKHYYTPRPLFDSLESLQGLYKACQDDSPVTVIQKWLSNCMDGVQQVSLPVYAAKEYQQALNFLYSYRGSSETFNAYRRELERFLQWAWFIHEVPINKLKRLDIESFIEFCQSPYKRWIGLKMVARFTEHEALRIPNPEWRPFIVKVSKKAFQEGARPDKSQFELTQSGIKSLFAVLSSFYNYLIQEEATENNPILQIRQKSKFIRTTSQTTVIRRLSDLQWQTVIKAAELMAEVDPYHHERTLFIMTALYSMYLRISELAASPRWTPKMHDFYRENSGYWWFKTVGKGNKERDIAVSDAMLKALKRWRKHLGLSALPTPDDNSPLLPKLTGTGPIESTRPIRAIVQGCFDKAVEALTQKGHVDEAEMLKSATVHWLRHTGISDDVKRRPREHVRDDAGHSSGAITDKYIDVERNLRAKSAKKKIINTKEN